MPLAAFASWTTRKTQPLSISHQGQFPAVTITFNLAQGSSLGTATEAIRAAERELGLPAALRTSFQGNAQAFQDSLSTVPVLIFAALVVIYLILGILYESGLGVPASNTEAYKWYALAARSGDKDAARRRDIVRNKLEPQSVKAADALVIQWRAKAVEAEANDTRIPGQTWQAVRR